MSKSVSREKSEDGFDRLARLIKETAEETEQTILEAVDGMIEQKLDDRFEKSENSLRAEMHAVRDEIHYRISMIASDVAHHLDSKIEPRLDNHERRIQHLELIKK